MITDEDILGMNFYKMEKFTGSYKGMRYLIRKETVAAGEISDIASDAADGGGTADDGKTSTSESGAADDASQAATTDIFRVTAWPGPYNFATTEDEKKTSATFPFTLEGKHQVVEWLNTYWEKNYK